MSRLNTAVRILRSEGLSGVRTISSKVYNRALQNVGKQVNYGHNFVEDDWDVLVILDACRADVFDETYRSHPISDDIISTDSIYSPASTSKEFMEKCYGSLSDNVLSEIHLITANGWEDESIDTDRFHDIDRVWQDHHDPEIGNIPPRPVTDAAIRAFRTSTANRFIVHYMQPHAPFVHCAGKYDSVNRSPGEGNSQNIWDGLKEGRFSESEILDDYTKNLEIALDEVDILLDNVSADVLITADHANAIGEWGVYGHPGYVPVPSVKRVPYARAKAVDRNTHDPETEPERERKGETTELSNHLEDLGYL